MFTLLFIFIAALNFYSAWRTYKTIGRISGAVLLPAALGFFMLFLVFN